ncbi:MAG TPA: TonB family protein [Puia sp.]|nr:TonB family protein [Puia sp.]
MKLLLTFCAVLSGLLSFSQPKENFYVLDSSWRQTVVDSAKYLFWVHRNDEGNWIHSYYHMWGPMIKMETYKDHDGAVRDGLACYYYSNGNIDSIGHYRDGKKEGTFYKYLFTESDTLKAAMKYDYVHDSLVAKTDFSKDDDDKDTSGDRKSEYPGGLPQWQRFLIKNLHYPDRAAGHGVEGKVNILFTVDEEGNVVDPVISKSVEYSLDRESLRMIRLSGKWEPGLEHGKIAKTFKIQPIRFVLESQ